MSESVTPVGTKVSSLAGKLAKRPAPPAIPPAPMAPTPETFTLPASPEPAPQTVPATGPQRGRGGTPRAATKAATKEGLRPVTFLTPVELRNRLRTHCRTAETTMRETLLDALEAHSDELADLIEAARPSRVRGPLFTRVVRSAPETRVQANVRLHGDELSVIDQLVVQYGAADRSELINAALNAYLSASGVRRPLRP